VLMRRLVGRCPFTDMFGKAGRNWLRGLELPVQECETVEAAMRQIEFLDAEVAEVERLIARDILWSADTRILLSVPGVGQPDLRRDVSRRDRRYPPVLELPQAGRLPRPGPEGRPIRL
jgi:hypothetical protein